MNDFVKSRARPVMEGRFYVEPGALIVDPDGVPEPGLQEDLRVELEDYEGLMMNDHAYCMSVEGSAQESNLWVPRNQHETFLTEADLQRFKNVAWNECVVKKFLAGRDGAADAVGQSMIDIVKNLNLQWGRLHIMGLHPKVESAEKQVVMVCMEKGLLPFDLDVGRVCRSLRRCDHFRDFFANAVGGQVVANSGRTPGLAKTQYGTDMDYAYKNKAQFYLERALQRHKDTVEKCLQHADHEDYVARLAKLRVVGPSTYETLDSARPPDRIVVGGGGGIVVGGGNDGFVAETVTAELRRQKREIDESVERLGRAAREGEQRFQDGMATHIERLDNTLRDGMRNIEGNIRELSETGTRLNAQNRLLSGHQNDLIQRLTAFEVIQRALQSGFQNAFTTLNEAITDIRNLQAAQPRPVDITGIQQQLDQIGTSIQRIPTQSAALDPATIAQAVARQMPDHTARIVQTLDQILQNQLPIRARLDDVDNRVQILEAAAVPGPAAGPGPAARPGPAAGPAPAPPAVTQSTEPGRQPTRQAQKKQRLDGGAQEHYDPALFD